MIQPPSAPPSIGPADTVWILVSTALVLLMTPAAAFFYGGLVRAKNALNTLMMCLGAFGVVGVTWALVGYSLAFSGNGRFVGDLGYLWLGGVGLEPRGTIPHLLFMAYTHGEGALLILDRRVDHDTRSADSTRTPS